MSRPAGWRIVALAGCLCSTVSFGAGMPSTGPAETPETTVAVPPASAWEYQVTPYLWAAGLRGDIVVGPTVPAVGVDADFADIFDHLRFAFMVEIEGRRGRLGWLADIAYLSLDVSATGPLGYVDGDLEDKTLFATISATYRVVENDSGWLDVLAGGRAWWRSDDLRITGSGSRQLSASRDKSWVDPVIGARARVRLTPDLFVRLYGDLGGFGAASDSTWQAAAVVDYRYSRTISFFAGYRRLAVDYDRGGYLVDLELSGPLLGASFRF